MAESFDVIVIGAGITGASTAYHLRALGVKRVLLLERGAPASGGTGKSAGIVRQHYTTPLMARLALDSVAMFERMDDELGAKGCFFQTGYVMLVPAELKARAQTNIEMQRKVGVATGWLPESDWPQRLPWLNPDGVSGVVFEPKGGSADTVRSTEAYVNGFRRLGGESRMKTPVRALLREADRVSGVMLETGPVHAAATVNAAGTWAHFLAQSACLELPLRTVREQDSVWQARGGRPVPDVSVSNAVDAIYLRPFADGRILIGQGFPKDYIDVDPYNYRETPDEGFTDLMQVRAERRFPPLAGMRLVTAYAALYDVTPDWYPFIGPRTGLAGYFDACGGSGHGFKVGPAIGKELAGWIATGSVRDDFQQLSYDRVAANRLFAGAYGGNRG
jgi:sarcosine oxidase, subunit beta